MATVTNHVDAVPALESGDHLTRVEFERRYDAMPHLKKAELINGVVYVSSPIPQQGHGREHVALSAWIGVYVAATPGLDAGDNSSLRLDLDNEPQPDLLLRLPEALGGQSRVDDEGYLEGAPELVAEVAASSAAYDLHDKLHVYRRHGVREYVVWRVLDRQVDWFALSEGRFDRLDPDQQGVYRSTVFPGLWLNVPALLGGDQAAVLQTLQQGIATPEHAQFAAKLKAAAEKGAE